MYNYVIFATPYDYIDAEFSQLKHYKNVKYIPNRIDSNNPIALAISKLYYNHIIKRIKLPIDKAINKFRFNNTFEDNNPIIFVFFAQIARHCNKEGTFFVEYLRKKYPTSVFVWYVVNPIEDTKKEEMEFLKKQFDILVSFDKSDANKWGIDFQERYFFSKHDIPNGYHPVSDVYFLGSQKDRMNLLVPIYDQLTAQGLKCDFYLSGECTDKKLERAGIHFNTHMSYSENLQHIGGTKCLLEIVQGGQSAPTTRMIESVYYNKKLLTNNKNILNQIYFNNNMLIYDRPEDITSSFFDVEYSPVSKEIIDYFNPAIFLEVLEEKAQRVNKGAC